MLTVFGACDGVEGDHDRRRATSPSWPCSAWPDRCPSRARRGTAASWAPSRRGREGGCHGGRPYRGPSADRACSWALTSLPQSCKVSFTHSGRYGVGWPSSVTAKRFESAPSSARMPPRRDDARGGPGRMWRGGTVRWLRADGPSDAGRAPQRALRVRVGRRDRRLSVAGRPSRVSTCKATPRSSSCSTRCSPPS